MPASMPLYRAEWLGDVSGGLGVMRCYLRADAQALLPLAFADALLAEPKPFLHAIFDYVAPRIIDGRIVLMGMLRSGPVRIRP